MARLFQASLAVVPIAMLALALAGRAAAADVRYTTAGWYLIASTMAGPYIVAGPFDDDNACQDELRNAGMDQEYTCDYLNSQPSWDR